MNELEKLLRDDLRAAARSVDIPVSLDAVSAQHAARTRRVTLTRWIAVAVGIALLVAAVWVVQSGLLRPPDQAVPNPLQTPWTTASPSTDPSSTTAGTPEPTAGTPEPTASGGAVHTTPAIVYFLVDTPQGPRLAREERQVTAATPARGALETMIAGALDPDYNSPLPPDTRVLGISHRDHVITVDLSGEALRANVGAAAEVALVQQITWTLTGILEPDARVRVLIEGEPAGWGHMLWDEPVATAPAIDTRLLVGIDAPSQGATVDSPVEVRGEAAVFEATLLYKVTDAAGTVVDQGSTMTAEGQTFAPYRFTLDLPAGEYTLTVHEENLSGDGGFDPLSDTRAFTVR